MPVTTQQFEQIATTVTERASSVLRASVWVVNEGGAVVASSVHGRGSTGRVEPPHADNLLRVPLRVGHEVGEVIVAESAGGELGSQRLGTALVELVISQALIVTQLPNRDELKNKFIHDLLRGRIGNEPDVMTAVELARLAGATAIALTGQTGGRVRRIADLTIRVPAGSIEQVEDAHLAIGHSLCVALRRRMRQPQTTRARKSPRLVDDQSLLPAIADLIAVNPDFAEDAATS